MSEQVVPTVTLDSVTEFSNAWNELRNAVVGQGTTKPAKVSQSLYDRVGNTYERWRTYVTAIGPATTVLQVSVLAGWVQDYRKLATEARAAGLEFPVMTTGVVEKVVNWLDENKGKFKMWTLALLATPIVCAVILRGGSRR